MPLLSKSYPLPEDTSRYFTRTTSIPLSPVPEDFKEKYKKGFREEIEAFNIKKDSNEEYDKRTFNRKRKRGKFNYKYFINIPISFKKDIKKAAK